MARRVAHIKKHLGNNSDPNLINLDSGGFANFYTEPGIAKTEALIRIFDAINLTAINISTRELAFDVEQFEALVKDAKTPYISCNIIEEESGNPRYLTHLILERNEKKIAIIGVTNKVIKTWQLSDGTTLATADPVERVKPIVEQVRDQVDMVILLAHMPRRKLVPLIEAVPGIDLALGGDGFSVTREPLQIGTTFVSYAGKQGEFLGSMKVKFTGNALNRKTIKWCD